MPGKVWGEITYPFLNFNVPDDTAAFASYTADWRCNVCGISTIYLRLGSSEGSLYLEGRSAMVSQDPTSEQQT